MPANNITDYLKVLRIFVLPNFLRVPGSIYRYFTVAELRQGKVLDSFWTGLLASMISKGIDSFDHIKCLIIAHVKFVIKFVTQLHTSFLDWYCMLCKSWTKRVVVRTIWCTHATYRSCTGAIISRCPFSRCVGQKKRNWKSCHQYLPGRPNRTYLAIVPLKI